METIRNIPYLKRGTKVILLPMHGRDQLKELMLAREEAKSLGLVSVQWMPEVKRPDKGKLGDLAWEADWSQSRVTVKFRKTLTPKQRVEIEEQLQALFVGSCRIDPPLVVFQADYRRD